jgi:hypothetical protein
VLHQAVQAVSKKRPKSSMLDIPFGAKKICCQQFAANNLRMTNRETIEFFKPIRGQQITDDNLLFTKKLT